MYGHDDFDATNIEVEFTEGSYAELWNKRRSTANWRTIFSFRSPYRFNTNIKISEVLAGQDISLNQYGASHTSDLDSKMESNYRLLLAHYNKHMRENDARPSEARQHVIGVLNQSLERCLELRIDDLGDVESSRGTIYFRKADQERPFEFNVLSAGEKEVVDILIDLYLRKDYYDDTVFLIDEPELHLNSGVQRRLLNEINALVGQSCQIWIATHSIGFLRALQIDLSPDAQVIYFEPSGDFGNSAYTLKPINKSHNDWIRIFDTALDDLAGLLSPKRVIYCEGRAESSDGTERGLDAQIYNQIFGEAYGDTVFVSSGGNTEPEQRSRIALSILKKIYHDVEVLILVDRDVASGKRTDESDRQEYLDNHPGHRVLRRWEIENYLYDPEVLTRYCAKHDRSLDIAAYSKHIGDSCNDNVKDKTGIVKNLCGIKGSISEDRFKIQLAKCVTNEMEAYRDLEDCIFHPGPSL